MTAWKKPSIVIDISTSFRKLHKIRIICSYLELQILTDCWQRLILRVFNDTFKTAYVIQRRMTECLWMMNIKRYERKRQWAVIRCYASCLEGFIKNKNIFSYDTQYPLRDSKVGYSECEVEVLPTQQWRSEHCCAKSTIDMLVLHSFRHMHNKSKIAWLNFCVAFKWICIWTYVK